MMTHAVDWQYVYLKMPAACSVAVPKFSHSKTQLKFCSSLQTETQAITLPEQKKPVNLHGFTSHLESVTADLSH